MALAAGVMLADSEKNLFHFPDENDVRMQPVKRQPGEVDWPFVREQGYLTCVFSAGERVAFFIPEGGDGSHGDPLLLSGNPMEQMAFYMMERKQFRPVDTIEELIRRVSPLADTAKKLCDLPRGTQVPGGDL